MSRNISEGSTDKTVAAQGFTGRQLLRRPRVTDRRAVLHIKVFSDTQTVSTGDGKFKFDIAEDMDGLDLTKVELYVTTVSSSGIVRVQVRNVTQAVDMLTTRVQVDANEKNSRYAATAVVIDLANDDVAWADELSIDVDNAGVGAKGLGIILEFS